MREMVRLGDICRKITDGTHHSPVNRPVGPFKYITAKNIKPWGLDLSDITYVDEPTHREIFSRCDVQPNDVLLVKDGATTGRVAVNTLQEPFSLLSSVGVLRPGPNLEPRYLAYALQSPGVQDAMFAKMSGVAITRLTLKKIKEIEVPVVGLDEQRHIVAEIDKQFSRLDEAVANLQRVKANLKRYERSTIQSLTDPKSFESAVSGCLADVAHSLDNMRKPVNKLERAKRPGTIPYLGANGPTGTIDVPLFDEELVLVVEDETFVGRITPFSYYFSGPCWVNNHTHVLRAKPDKVLPKYLNLALSYYPFIPLTTGSTGRRKLTKAALMAAPITVPTLEVQRYVISEADRRLSVMRQVHVEVEANLHRAQALKQSVLTRSFKLQ